MNGFDLDGNRYASAIWCYIVFPLIGAIFAALLFRLHVSMDNRALKQREAIGEHGVSGRNVGAVVA